VQRQHPHAPTAPPDGLVLPKYVFPPFWAAYTTLGHGPMNGLAVLRDDVLVQLSADGPEAGLSAHGRGGRLDGATRA
jgi:hypothetical protein